MTKRGSRDGLHDLDAICTVRRMDLEMQVARSQAHVRELERRRKDAMARLGDAQDGWRQAISRRSLDMTVAAVWSTDILQAQANVETLVADIQRAATRSRQLGEAQAAAAARCDAIDILRAAALRRGRKRRDERLMEDYGRPAVPEWRSPCE